MTPKKSFWEELKEARKLGVKEAFCKGEEQKLVYKGKSIISQWTCPLCLGKRKDDKT